MNSVREVFVAAEGYLDFVVAKRVLKEKGLDLKTAYWGKGKDHLKQRIEAYNKAAMHWPWLVLVDLDSEPCAPGLRSAWISNPSKLLCFCVVVRSIEAWLMADRSKLAEFLGIDARQLPSNPESLDSPKDTLINLARQSRKRTIREGLVPDSGSGRPVGKGYPFLMGEFVEKHWRPSIAAQSAASLDRTLTRLVALSACAKRLGVWP